MKTFNVVFVFGLCGLLAWLKVGYHADLSWPWVFAPIWLPMAIVVGTWVVLGLGAVVISVGIWVHDRRW